MRSPLFIRKVTAGIAAGALILLGGATGLFWTQAQTTSDGVISGTVTIDRGTVTAFRIKAKDTVRRISYTVYTNKGRYNIYNLPAGHYEVSVLEDVEPMKQTVDVSSGKTAIANLAVKSRSGGDLRVGIAGARAQENYGGVHGTAKATARIVDFDELYPPGRGRDLITFYCLGCHGPAAFHQRGFGNEAVWRARVEKMFSQKSGILFNEPMIGTGVISEQDKNTIIKYLADNFGPNSESRDLATDPLVRDEEALSQTVFVQYELPSMDEVVAQGFGFKPRRTTHDVFPSLLTPGVVWVAGNGTSSILRVDTRNPDAGKRNKEYFVKNPGNINVGVHGVIEVPGRVYWTELRGDHVGELDTKTGEIRRYPQLTLGGGHTPRADSKGNVWFTEVSGNGKIGRWDAQTKRVTEYDPVKGANYYGVIVDKKDRVFVAGTTKKSLVMWNPKTEEWTNLNPPSNVRRVALDSKDNVWACSYGNNSIIRVDTNTLKMEEYRLPLKNGNPYAIYVDKEDNVWAENAVYNAFVMFNPKTKKFTYFPFPELDAHTPNMEMDAEGTIWFGLGSPSQLTALKLRGNAPGRSIATR